jgi:hypothetical protein
MFLLSSAARYPQKGHLKHASCKGAEENITSTDDYGWSQNQWDRKVEM